MKLDYPESIFRFRPYSPLSLKELQYGEVFFVTRDELNDPYDTKSPAIFEPAPEIYKRLFNLHLNQLKGLAEFVDERYVDEFSNYLSKSPLLQDELIDVLDSSEMKKIVDMAFSKMPFIGFGKIFISQLKHSIIKGGGLCYVASFSKICTDPVMWSHYASQHNGFCLCFSYDKGVLNRDRNFKKDHFFPECKFEEVRYSKSNVFTNGFLMFPKFVYGKDISEQERNEYWELRRQSYLTKYSSWSYEQEVRIVIDDWFGIRSSEDGAEKKKIIERIFRYDQRQLTGIIFGSRMTTRQKDEVRTILYGLRSNLLERDNVFYEGRFSGSYLPIFLFYQARQGTLQYEMEIEPIDGLDATNRFFTIDNLEVKKKELLGLQELYQKQDEYRKAKNLPGPVGVNGTNLT